MDLSNFLHKFNTNCPTINNKITYYGMMRKKIGMEELERDFFTHVDDLITIMLLDKYDWENASKELIECFFSKVDLYCDGIIEQSENLDEYMVCIWILLKHMDEDQKKEVITKCFSKEFYYSERNGETKNFSDVSGYYARLIIKTINTLLEYDTEYKWEDSYFSIIGEILKIRKGNQSFALKFEKTLQDIKFTNYDIGMLTYFDLLIKDGNYDAAKIFLERIEDCSNCLFLMDDEQIKDKLCQIPSVKIVFYCKKYIEKKDSTYTDEQWLADVYRHNSDLEVKKWCKTYVQIGNLYEYIVEKNAKEEDTDYVDFLNETEVDLFDLKTNSYMTNMLVHLVSIFNYVIENKWDVCKFLKVLGKLNLFDYSHISTVGHYKDYDRIKEITDFENLKNSLFLFTSAEDILNVYMNTHLKFGIEFREVVEKVAKINRKDVRNVFSKYSINGIVEFINMKESTRDKIFLKPKYLYTEYTNKFAIEKRKQEGFQNTQVYFDKVIRNDQNWYSKNKLWGELLKAEEECTFQIEKCSKEGFIFASNIRSVQYPEAEIKNRNASAYDILAWLRQIQTEKRVVEWPKNKKIYCVSFIQNFKRREEIAFEIVKTVDCLLQTPDECSKFWRFLSKYPYEELNEFRVIYNMKANNFYISDTAMTDKIVKMGDRIFADHDITDIDKCNIYFSTCLKKYYKLEDVVKQLGVECVKKQLKIKRMTISVVYKETIGEYDYFITGLERERVFYSDFDFICKKTSELQIPGEHFLATFDGMDTEKSCIYVTFKDKDNEIQDILRGLYDIKKIVPVHKVK